MLKYGALAKGMEMMCFKPALEALKGIYPDMDMESYKKRVKKEFKAMLLRTPDIGGSSLESNLYIAAKFTAEEIKSLAEKAKKVIPERVRHYAPLVGVDYGRITIRCQRTRWGSCSSKGNLNFNCLLMLMPDEVIDSVVVHELCHRKQMNHSKAFYAEVERVFPEYKRWNKWLKDNGGQLIKRLPSKRGYL